MASKRLKTTNTEVRGEQFNIREWTTTERTEFLKRCSSDNAMSAGPYIVHRCTLDDNGNQLWKSENLAGEEPPELVDGLMDEICKLSGLEDLKKKEPEKTEEDAAKNG